MVRVAVFPDSVSLITPAVLALSLHDVRSDNVATSGRTIATTRNKPVLFFIFFIPRLRGSPRLFV